MAQHTATATATTERSCTGFRGQTLAPARFASRGGAGDDHSGDARANSLTGFGGADVLEGGGGDESIDAALQDAVASTARRQRDVRHRQRSGHGRRERHVPHRLRADPRRSRRRSRTALDLGAARAGRTGSVTLTFRTKDPLPGNVVTSRSTLRLVDRKGRATSSNARFVLGNDVLVTRQRVRLPRATRRRLARSRSGALR